MISRAQVEVLSVLEPGGILSIGSVARSSRLTESQTRAAVLRLKSAGLIVPSGLLSRSGYQITDRGRHKLSTHGRNS
ncbi:hypothetical protein [Nocardia brasiliensis]|uniref:hypothetical protein n=1 Tax=Nocardia brasiliensis TaxID=37326 RepID=UPI00366C9E54